MKITVMGATGQSGSKVVAHLRDAGHETPVVVDSSATYFGTPLQETSLVTGADAVIAGPRLADWLEKEQ